MNRLGALRTGHAPVCQNRKKGVAAGLVLAAAPLLLSFAEPASAKSSQPATEAKPAEITGTGIADFYAYRRDYPLWLSNEAGSAANDLIALLESARLDGLNPDSYGLDAIHRALADVTAAKASQSNKNKKQRLDVRAATLRADRLLSQAFVAYVGDLRRDPGLGVTYVEPQLQPQPPVTRFLLEDVARASSPSAYLKGFSWVNPTYASLRKALAEKQYDGDKQRATIALNLERARILPVTKQRYIVVNAAEQKLSAYEDGRKVDEMRVVVGKPKNPTPMMVALIRFAALNPYWFVPPDLAAERIAPKVLKQGLGYLKLLGHEVMTDWSENASVVDPKTIDWKAVAEGKTEVLIRQLPGPHNSMGRMKFMFPNEAGIYLHDNPERELFSEASRLYSGGCVRLEDAQRLGAWMFGHPLDWEGATTEQQVPLERPIPVYITYLTAVPQSDGSIAFFDDVYQRDPAQLAALNIPMAASAGANR